MANKQISKAATILIKAREFLSNIDNWCPEGLGTSGYHQDAMTKQEKFCALRAIGEILEDGDPFESGSWQEVEAYNELRKYVVSCLGHAANKVLECHPRKQTVNHIMGGVIGVNALGHEYVLKLYDLAIDSEIRESVNVVQS